MAQVEVENYMCPSCPMQALNPKRSNNAKSNYKAIMSDGNEDSDPDYDDVLRDLNSSPYGYGDKFNGMMWYNSETRFGDCTDGTSNTLIVGEQDGAQLPRNATCWIGANRGNWINTCMAVTSRDPRFTINGSDQWGALGSTHPGGANFVRTDGSVVFISETVDGDTYEAMGTRNGGEVAKPL